MTYDIPHEPFRPTVQVQRAMEDTAAFSMFEDTVFQVHRQKRAAAGTSNLAAFFNELYGSRAPHAAGGSAAGDPLRTKLEELQLLQPGWDGRGADAPSGAAVDATRSVLEMAARSGRAPDRLAADVEGGVAVYFFGGDRGADGGHSRQAGILIDNSGEAYVYHRRRGAQKVQRQAVASTADELRDVISEIITFLRD